ncbi:MAG: NUDIX hydrolase, partial [Actinomycetota bacterium]|nr:NUDIX hydrolase [Actinomycetota bacterium]
MTQGQSRDTAAGDSEALRAEHVRVSVPRIGLGAVVLTGESILLVRRGRPPHEGSWSLPGGKLRFGETIAGALEREVLEETGLLVEVGRLAGVLESIDAQRTFHYVILDYFARVRGGVLRPGDDATDARWVRLD